MVEPYSEGNPWMESDTLVPKYLGGEHPRAVRGILRELSAFQGHKIRYAKTESRTAVPSLIRW
jgi:hypothetical protein